MSRFPVRVVCHAVLRIDLEPHRVRVLEAEVKRRCDEADAKLMAFVVALGAPKKSPDEYPALDYFRAGKADALMVVRAPLFDRRHHDDLLTAKTLSGGLPLAWVPAYELRRLGLLPPAIGVSSFARLHAAALRELRFTIEAIALWLDAEGYAPAPRAGRSLDALRRAKAPSRTAQYSTADVRRLRQSLDPQQIPPPTDPFSHARHCTIRRCSEPSSVCASSVSLTIFLRRQPGHSRPVPGLPPPATLRSPSLADFPRAWRDSAGCP